MRWKWAQFRYLSQRPVFTTWKDASAVLWDPGFAHQWTARFQAFGFRDELRDRWDLSRQGEVRRIRRNLTAHYRELDDSDVQEMAGIYRIDYWIAPVDTATEFPEVARAGEYKILDLP